MLRLHGLLRLYAESSRTMIGSRLLCREVGSPQAFEINGGGLSSILSPHDGVAVPWASKRAHRR